MHIDAAVALAGDGAGDVIADAEGAMAFAAAFTQGSESIGGFPALADDKDEGVAGHGEVAVAELAGEFAFGRDAGEGFNEVFAHHGGVHGGAAAAEDDAFNGTQLGVGHVESAEFGGGLLDREAAAEGVAHAIGLLVDFLEHVVREFPATDVFGGEFDLLDFVGGSVAAEGGDFKFIGFEDGDFVVLEIDGFAGVGDHRADIAGEEVLAFAEAEDEWAAAAGTEEDSGDGGMNEGDAVGARDTPEGAAEGLDESGFGGGHASAFEFASDQFGENFGVGLGGEDAVFGFEFLAEFLVVFNDAIVDECKLAGLVEMGVGIGFGDCAVCGPAGVADAEGAREGVSSEEFCKAVDASDAFASVKEAVIPDGHAGGVVAAVFQPAQSIQ